MPNKNKNEKVGQNQNLSVPLEAAAKTADQIFKMSRELRETKAQLSDLQNAVVALRQSWIAPHRFSVKEAEYNLVEVSNNLQCKEVN